jgi:folate-binding protein YgfZ
MERLAFFLDLGDWAVVRITGPDALEFLQGVGTQDIATLRVDSAKPSLFLSERGRPIALAWAVLNREGGGATLLVEPGGREALLPHLDRLRVMEEVSFDGPAGMPRLYGAAGPDRSPAAHEWAAALPGGEAIDAEPATFLLVPPGVGKPGSEAALTSLVVSPEAAEAWRVAAGIPRAGVDFDQDRIATELSLPQAISLDKGCFVGQEVVARTTHRGAVRRHRIGFRYTGKAGILPRGTELRAGGGLHAGMVTSTVLEPGTGRGLGMGYLTTETLQNPAEVLAIQGTVTTPIEVAPWPL